MTRNNNELITHYQGGRITVEILPVVTTISNLNMTRNNSELITHYLEGSITVEILPVELRSATSV